MEYFIVYIKWNIIPALKVAMHCYYSLQCDLINHLNFFKVAWQTNQWFRGNRRNANLSTFYKPQLETCADNLILLFEMSPLSKQVNKFEWLTEALEGGPETVHNSGFLVRDQKDLAVNESWLFYWTKTWHFDQGFILAIDFNIPLWLWNM